MSYEQFYGLKEQPFSITPDPRFFYESDQHMGALIHIQHAIDTAKGLIVLIGGLGFGKTFLCRKIHENLCAEENKYKTALLIVIHHKISSQWLLKKIALQLGVEYPSDDKPTLISQLCRQLIQIDESGEKAVVLIDEAHMLQTPEIYEEIRGLLNIEGMKKKLLNIILFGPPDLEKYMKLDPPLVSRIGLKYVLKPLDEKNAIAYILYRLKVAGATHEIFTPESLKIIFKYSKGVPRAINVICDNVLFEGFIEKKTKVDSAIAEEVASGLLIDEGVTDENAKQDNSK